MSTNPQIVDDLWTPVWNFSDRIRRIRREVGVSQDSFADSLQVKKVTLSAWEAGRTQPRDLVSVAKRIELAFRVPASWTLGLNTENRHPDNPNGGSQFSVHPPGLEPGTHCFRVAAEKPQASESNVIEFRPARDGGSIGDDHAAVIPFPTRGVRDECGEALR